MSEPEYYKTRIAHLLNENYDHKCQIVKLNKENERLKQTLRIYRNVANCANCYHHTYDWYDDGDEFEVCKKGNDMSDMICEEWEEL